MAQEYIDGVINGSIYVAPVTRQTFLRHQRDLERSKSAAFPYEFDAEYGAKVCRFLALHPHIQGDLSGDLFEPEAWQAAFVVTLYGWRVKGNPKRRRFRRASLYVPRGNGKTFLGSGLCDYHAFADGEGGASVYSFAVSKDQANLSWNNSQAQLRHEKMAKVKDKLGIEVGQRSITQAKSNSFFKSLAADTDSLDGLNVSFGLGDEVAAHPSRTLYDVIVTATAKRSSSLLLTISTFSGNTTSIGKELCDHGRKVLDGTIQDDGFYILIYECPPELLDTVLTSEKAWRAANPNFGKSVQADVFAQLAENARQNPSARSAFLTKCMNIWTDADAPYYDLTDFDACCDGNSIGFDMQGMAAYGGLDLASKLDLACAAYVTPYIHEDGQIHYIARVDSYINEDQVADTKNVHYARWQEQGDLIVTPGSTTDYATIEADIIKAAEKLYIQSISFDQWQATYLAQRIEAAGLTPVETRMTTAFLSAPMKELAALMRQRRIHFIGPTGVLRWCLSNVVSKDDARGNPYPRKERPESKIDAVTALLLALGRAMVNAPMASDGNDFRLI